VDPLIEVRGLSYRYPNGTLALDGLDFELREGESVVLFGPNGSGKTTFVLHLNALIPSSGSVTVCGLPVERNVAEVRRRIGLVFQNSDDQLFMPTILDDVQFGPLNLRLHREEAHARAVSALTAVGITEGFDRAPWRLSAGEKRRVAIAGVLAMQPEVLVLDEPTTFLDPPGRRELIHTLNSLPQAKIIVTHDVPFAHATCTRAVFFEKGRIAGAGSVDEVSRTFDWES
jgi:cobalt/nickel transport system ATP-binding protein